MDDNFKLAVSINLFDELFLLKKQITQIRDHVDFILINYQDRSYFGNELPSYKDDIKILNDLKDKKIIDEINIFKIDNFATNIPEAKELERKKRNEGRSICLNKKYNYFLDVDCDEFYKKEEFKKAKEHIVENNLYFSACHFINYQHKPVYQSKNISNSIVPFICRLDEKHELTGAEFLGRCDPTRGYHIIDIPKFKTKLFSPDELLMHHMTGIRKNLYDKYQYTSLASLNKNNIVEVINLIESINDNNLILDHNFKFLDKEYQDFLPSSH